MSVLLAAGQGITGILKSAELFTPNHAPIADVQPPVAAANEGSAVNFDGRGSSDPDGDALTYAWDFGDGAVGSGPTVTHTYADNGSYAVMLTVSDGNSTSTATTRAEIANVVPAVGDLGTAALLRGETFARDGAFADPGADTWTASVDYGDGSSAEPLALVGMTFHLSHVYAVAGSYTATVTVTDDDAGVGTAQAHVTVSDHAPVANAGPAAHGDEGSAVSFNGSASSDADGDPLTLTWDFGDGSPPVGGVTPSHVYADNGSYVVTLNVFDGALIATATTTAEIANVAPVVSDLGSGAIFKNEAFLLIGSFVDPGVDVWTATVDYGDGSGVQSLALSGKSFNLSHVYSAAGTFSVAVAVRDDDGGVGTAEAQVTVTNRAPVANAGPVARGSEGGSVGFDGRASSDPDGDALTLTWDFGDGSAPVGGPAPSHVYADNGTYTVTLSVSDGELTSSATTTADIANVAPALSDLGSSSQLAGQTYRAAGSFVDPGADSWTATVDYGDGSGVEGLVLSGKTFSLSHVYPVLGTFIVTVTVTDDDGGVGTAHGQVQVTVSNHPPLANAGAAVFGNEGSTVAFDGRGSSDPDGDVLTYSWTFGDGGTGSGATPSHVYADNGAYSVTLTVSDGEFQAQAATTAQIENVAPAVSAFAGASLLPGDSYAASGSFTDPGADTWIATVDYGDGTGTQPLSLSGQTFSLSHVYTVGGTFTVTVSVRDADGGVGTSRATVAVQTPQQAVVEMKNIVADLQASGQLTPATANSWTVKLNAIIAEIDAGNISGAIADLVSFIDKVQKTPHMSSEGEQTLVDAANAILRVLRSL